MQERRNLRDLRESLDASREDIAKQTGVTIGTIRNAELGKRVTRRSAMQIVQAVNNLLKEAGQSEVTLNDLELTLPQS